MADEQDGGHGKVHLPVVVVADKPLRHDMDDGLRFAHGFGMQVKHDLFDATTRLFALMEELIAGGKLDVAAFEQRRARIREREEQRHATQVRVHVSTVVDKYALTDLPQVDCAGLMPICKARCCKLDLQLSFQDLNEGIVKWDYSMPYLIRKQPNKRCVHQDEGSGGCTIHEHRPAACRVYDCRDDKRIWIDFEQKIPAPDLAD